MRSLLWYDKEPFLADLLAVNRTDIFYGCNIDPARMAEMFSSIFSSVLDVHAPLKCRGVSRKSTPWVTPKLKQLMGERDQLKNRAAIDLWHFMAQ